MKPLIFLVLVLLFTGSLLQAQVSVSGSNGADGAYTSLTKAGGAFAAINSVSQAGKTITITITGNVTTEDGTNALTGAAGMWTALTITPSGNRTISGSHGPSGLIEMNGASYVTINGINDGTNALTIENTNTGGPTIRLLHGATNDVVTNASVKGCSTSWGVIFYLELTGTSASCNNSVTNCDIGPSGSNHPKSGIYSYSSSASLYNNGITVTGNHIHDFIGAGSNGYGILIEGSTGSDWTISGNSLYLTSAVYPTSGTTHAGIYINNPNSNNIAITGNYIGGSAPSCAGTWVDDAMSQSTSLYGIRFNAGTGTACSAQGNTIGHIFFRAATSALRGISLENGIANLGTTTGNTISQVTISSVCQGSTYGFSYGIYNVSSSSNTIANNSISGITVQSFSGGTNTFFNGIYSAGPSTISNNTISGATNSITSDQSGSQLIGIYTEYANVITTNGNTIRDIQHSGAETGSGASSSIIGMRLAATGAGQTAYGNTIFNLANTSATGACIVEGIYYSGPTTGTNNVYGNRIHSLTTTSSSTGAAVFGLYITAGSTTFYNNMIALGAGITTDNTIEGIYENGTSASVNLLYYNSVNISGTAPSGATVNTYALYNNANTDTRNFRNNIFQNSRGNTSGTAKHYAISLAGNSTLTIDYNDYFVSGTGGVLGRFSGTDETVLAAWQVATGQDLHSQNVTAPFVSATDLHIPVGTSTTLAAGATTISGVTTDYDGQTRSNTTPDIGADEFHEFVILVAGSNGTDGAYTSLTKSGGAFASINSVSQVGKTITITIIGDVITEDGTNALTGAAGMWTTLTITPSGNRTISGSRSPSGLIEVSGAKYVKINGKNDGTNSLVIENTNTGGQTIRLIAGTMGAASYDTVVNCTLRGSSTSWGVFSFWELNTATTNNNDYLGYCDIGPSGSNQPQCGVYSFATTNYNNGVTVTGNKIHDFLRTGTPGYGIYMSDGGGSNWTISANSFYLTSPIRPTAYVAQAGIYVSSSTSNNIAVTGNYIGGSAPYCTGTWVDTVYNQTPVFNPILFSGGTTTASSIQGNTIQNILFKAKTSAFTGINVNSGLVNVGNTTGNTISGITILSTYSSTGNGTAYGIQGVSASYCTIANNTISGIIVQAGPTGTGTSFTGIYTTCPSTISGNTIGSASANSITSDQSAGQLIGISTAGSVSVTVQSNTIRNFQHTGAKTGNGGSSSVIGIYATATGSGQTISGNTLFNLANTHSSALVVVQGIDYTGPTTGTNTVSGNLVHSLTLNPSNSNGAVFGMWIAAGTTSYFNNMVSLGAGITGNNLIEGIYENCPAGYTTSLYFNSVSISGTAPSGATSNTFAMYNGSNGNIRDYRNNIFQNSRSNTSGTAKHYAISLSGNSTLTIDYNDYYASGIGGVLGSYAGADKTTLAAWKTATGQDSHSINVTAPYVSATDLHIPTGTSTTLAAGATAISGVTTDYDGQTRSNTTPDIGADEFHEFDILVAGSNGKDGYYSSLTRSDGAFIALNSVSQVGKTITITIIGDVITEDGTNALTGAAGMWTALTITPSGNRTISGSRSPSGLIELSGAKYVKINGKNDGTNSLIIENTNTGGQTIRLIAGTMGAASNDTVVNCTLKGCSIASGVISFSELNTATANNYDYLGYCDIGPSGSNQPQCGVYSFASTNYNNGVTVTGNKIHDFLRTGANGYGIFMSSNSGSNWTISANSFYLTSAIRPTAGVTHAGIYVGSSTCNNITVTGNYIGGSLPVCGGSAWVDTVYNQSTAFFPIYLSCGIATASSVQGNIIKNILFRAKTSAFTGIIITSGLVNVGNTIGNTISGITILSPYSSDGNGTAFGIRDASASSCLISNNTISGITVQAGPTGTGTSFTGIFTTCSSTIIGNTIGSESASNITCDQSVGQLIGIYTAGAVTSTIQSNTIRNFQHTGARTGNGGYSSVIGIYATATGSGQTVSGNTIYNLANTHSSALVIVQGINYAGPTTGTNNVSGNLVHSLTLNPSNSNGGVFGMWITAGTTNYFNNMISLGAGITGNSLIEGIYENCPTGNNNNFYFNSVSISGTAPAGASANTYVFYNNLSGNTRDYRNNIFQNSRSNTSGTAKHYAFYLSLTSNLTMDYNDYFVSGTGGMLGCIFGTDVGTFSIWQAVTGQDVHSMNAAAPFVSSTDLHIPLNTTTSLAGAGKFMLSYLLDFDAQYRKYPSPDIGADEFYNPSFAIVSVSGSNGQDGNYPSLSTSGGAFAALNGTSQSGKNITVTIVADGWEDGTNALTGAAGMWNTLKILPAGTRTLTGSSTTTGLIELSGARNVKIDGKNDGTNSLAIENTNPGGPTIRLINGARGDAAYDTIVNCILRGCSTSRGVVALINPAASGNSYVFDYIGNCDIGRSGVNCPMSGIYYNGSANGVNISGNHIHDFLGQLGPGAYGYGIYIVGSTGSELVISSNSMYLTSPVHVSDFSVQMGIYVSLQFGTDISVTGNYIGGSLPGCNGSAWVDTSYNQGVTFYGILMNTGANTTASQVENNTIRNILFESLRSFFVGISINGGVVNVGDVTGNTVSDITILSPYSDSGNGTAFGIRDISSSACQISNNIISGITVQAGPSGTGTSFTGIYTSGPSTISGNIIGSASAINITSDQSAGQLIGINTDGSYSVTVQSNTIRNFQHTGASTGNGGTSSVIGIYAAAMGDGQVISGNTIYNLANMHSTAGVVVQGIDYAGPSTGTNNVSGNLVHSLTLNPSNSNGAVYGMWITTGTTTFSNNMVSLGAGITGNSLIEGIYVDCSSGSHNFYFNSVSIGGTASAPAIANSYAFYSDNYGHVQDYRNNIFQNSRSNTNGSARHYAVYLFDITSVTIDYNDYFVSGIGGMLGSLWGVDINDLQFWQWLSGQDLNTQNVYAPFVSATDLHIPFGTSTSLMAGGIPIPGITTDFDQDLRSSTNPDIGADEFQPLNITWTGNTNTDWNTMSNWSPQVVPDYHCIVTIPAVPNQPVINTTGNKCLDINVQHGAILTINPGMSLEVDGSMVLEQ